MNMKKNANVHEEINRLVIKKYEDKGDDTNRIKDLEEAKKLALMINEYNSYARELESVDRRVRELQDKMINIRMPIKNKCKEVTDHFFVNIEPYSYGYDVYNYSNCIFCNKTSRYAEGREYTYVNQVINK